MASDLPSSPSPARYSYAPSILARAITLPVIDTIVVASRFAARRKQRAYQGADDWLNFGALLFVWASAVTMYVGVGEHALGYPMPDASSTGTSSDPVNESLSNMSKIQWVQGIMGIVALGLMQLQFLFFLRRIFNNIFPKSYQTFSFFLWASITLSFAWMVTCFVAHIAQCNNHLEALWATPWNTSKYCTSSYAITLSNSIINTILHGILILLPLFMASQVKMTAGQKLASTLALLIGLLSLSLSIVVLTSITQAHNPASTSGVDAELYASNLVWWSFFDTAVSLLATNLPALWPLFRDIPKHRIVEDLKTGLEALGYVAAPSMNGETPVLSLRSSSLAAEKEVVATCRSQTTLRADWLVEEIRAARRGDEHEFAVEHRALEMALII